MKKTFCFSLISALALFSLTQATFAFATENDLNSVPPPVIIIINGSEAKLINFNLDKTAILDLPADSLKETASMKLAPDNQDREILLSCGNQHITGDKVVNCPVSRSSITQVRLTDIRPVKKEEKSITQPMMIFELSMFMLIAYLVNLY